MASFSLDAFTPTEVIAQISQAGVHKGNMRLDKIFFSAFSAGCLLAFACGTALSTNTTTWFQDNAPGLIRTISALVFPYGLCMIILTGADLCTGSFMVRVLCIVPKLNRSQLALVHNRCCSRAPFVLVEDANPLGCHLLWKPCWLSLRGWNHIRM